MKTSFPMIVASALLGHGLLAEPPDNAKPQAPDAKAGTRLKFQAYDGNEKEQAKMTFQVNTLDIRQPAQFLNIGSTISSTPYKLVRFAFKEVKNPQTGELMDVSELTVVNTKTQKELVLVLDKVVVAP
jgi:hypothetical protein